MNVPLWQVFFLKIIWKRLFPVSCMSKDMFKIISKPDSDQVTVRTHKSEIPVPGLCNIEVINPDGFWTSKVWKINFTPPSWETRIDFWVYSPISQQYPGHLGITIPTALVLNSKLSAFVGIWRQEQGTMRRPSKLNPENGKSQSMAGSPALLVLSSNSLEEAWRTAPKHCLRAPSNMA